MMKCRTASLSEGREALIPIHCRGLFWEDLACLEKRVQTARWRLTMDKRWLRSTVTRTTRSDKFLCRLSRRNSAKWFASIDWTTTIKSWSTRNGPSRCKFSYQRSRRKHLTARATWNWKSLIVLWSCNWCLLSANRHYEQACPKR